MWGDSEKPDPLLLGDHRHLPHHPHHHHHHFGLTAKPFYHPHHAHNHHHLGGSTHFPQMPATSSSTPTASATIHHHNLAGTSVGGSLSALRMTRAAAQPVVMWKGETSRKKRFG
ncbi:unnamed protein product [Caenorhabditis angaria]|uniref:Uncharacterized protein n=1 Tax=Caenorhabditis angaria TaxID=860376 RepID=A0A9P1MWE5_9PELO|nr:unnamed protein product [Caenorhabditis angaria]